jgi:hypothetical protein
MSRSLITKPSLSHQVRKEVHQVQPDSKAPPSTLALQHSALELKARMEGAGMLPGAMLLFALQIKSLKRRSGCACAAMGSSPAASGSPLAAPVLQASLSCRHSLIGTDPSAAEDP